ncbi:MAG: MFS transporter [Actinomycetota bacterium]
MLLDSGGLFIAFPFIEERFERDASRTTISWVVTAFFVVMVATLLVAGRLADRFGRRRVFLIGAATYAAGSLVGAVAADLEVLIGSRVVQGVGVALLSPSSVAMALTRFPPSRRALALGVWGTVGAVSAMAAAPVAAGIVEVFGWRGVFVMNGALAAAAFGAGRVLIDPDEPSRTSRPVRVAGAAAAMVAVGSLCLVLVQGPEWGWSASTAVAAATTLVASAVFTRHLRTDPHPLLDVAIFRERRFVTASAVSVCCQLGFFSVYFGLPLLMTEAWDWSPWQVGLGLAPLNGISALTAVPAGRHVDRHGPRMMMGLGGVVSAAALLALGFWLFDAGYRWVLPGLLVAGVAAMAIGNHTTVAALADVDDRDLGSANAGYFTTRRLGSALGAVAVAAIVGNTEGGAFVDRYDWVWAFGAAAYLIGGAIAFASYPRAWSPRATVAD